MSDTEPQIEETEQHVEQEPMKKAPAKGKMTDKKMENLAKARAARKANLDAKKYSKEKRSSAEERIEAEIERRAAEVAEKKAIELLEKQKQEAELEEYRQWKKEQAKLAKEKEAAKQSKKKEPLKPKPKKKVLRKVVASDSDEYLSEDEEPLPKKRPVKRQGKQTKQQYDEDSYSQPGGYSFNINDMLD